MRKVLSLLIIPVLLIGCAKVKEAEVPQEQEGLHEVVFHAGWDTETRTVLQEDGSVWWSPGDEISLFIKGDNGYNEDAFGHYGYKLTATNTEPAPKADFVGQIGEVPSDASYFAIYPYQSNLAYWEDGDFVFIVPSSQEACEGTFNKNLVISAAISNNQNLYFRNLCGGIKFSVANEGIDRITIEASQGNPALGDPGDYIAGYLRISPNLNLSWERNILISKELEIIAPNGGTFKPGTYYYIILPAMDYRGLKITYHKGNEIAIFREDSGITIKRSTFKRLYNKDADLTFKKIPESKAPLFSPILPEGIDPETITEANFYVNSDKKTETVIGPAWDGYETVYFEQIGTAVNYYTSAEVYEVLSANSMFSGWRSLEKLDLSAFLTDKCDNFSGMFEYCSSLKMLDLSNFDTHDAHSFYGMFRECRNLRTIDLSSFQTSSASDFGYMFQRCINLSDVDVTGFDFRSAESVRMMFEDCHLLSTIDTHEWKSSTISDMNSMFHGCRNVTSLDISGLDLTHVDDMQSMFSDCQNLTELKLSKTRTACLKTWGVAGMFSNCQKLKTLDLSNFDTSDVTDLSLVFFQCYNLESINLEGWDTSNVTNMQWMFLGCSSLQNINLSMFDTGNVTNMNKLFSGCRRMKSLDLSHWNTSNVTDLSYAFEGCMNLEQLNISSFTSNHMQNVYYLFGHANKLSAIDMGDFDLSTLSPRVFYQIAKNSPQCYVRCTPQTKTALEQNNDMQDISKIIWITDGSPLPENISSMDESLYYSSDFSKDKTVRIVQKASVGLGIDLVLMGDGYSDRMINAGDYDRDMERAIDGIFSYEPFASFKELFNILIIYAVSDNEVIGKSTAFSIEYNSDGIRTNDSQAIFSYSMSASSKGDQREIATVVVVNSDIGDGVAYNFMETSAEGEVFDYHNDLNWDDYHGGKNFAIVSGPSISEFNSIVIHEFGHSFGNLADEYTYSDDEYATLPENIKNDLLYIFPYGLWKNIDVTDDPATIKWHHFLTDSRYSESGTGVFEGGKLYRAGVWRPSEESVMNNHLWKWGFNAPSREAIYYRIHKLAYGKDWSYDFEDFVQWDLKNIQHPTQSSARYVPSPLRVDRAPYFKMEESITNDGKKMITIIMN